MKITNEKQLRELGFKKYPKTEFDHQSVKYRYQKCCKEGNRTKYYLDCLVWDWTWTDRVPFDTTFEFQAQLYLKGTHNAVNLTFISSASISEIEESIEKAFEAGIVEFYDTAHN